MRSRETRGEVSRQINYIDFQLECFEHRKNTSFYTHFGRNRLIEAIDGYDETVHDEPFQKYRGRRIEDGASGCDSSRCVIKRV